MTALADRLAAIGAGPAGPSVAAYFDFDGTLVDGYSAAAYYGDRVRHRQMGRREAADVLRLLLHGDMDEPAFAAALEQSLTPWAGRPEADFAALWQRLFAERYGNRLFPEAWALVKAHQRRGHTVVIATSAMAAQVAPVAAELGIDAVLCTQVTIRDGELTGEVERPTLWGSGKAEAVRAHARAHGLDLSHAHAYANGDEDIDFLRLAGHPAAVNPGRRLAGVAAGEAWPVLRFPRRKPEALARARTVAAYGALAVAALGGVAYAAVTGRRQRGAELACELGAKAMLAISGIRVEVEGDRSLLDRRPSVFLFNHQSHLDAYLLLALLRRDFVGVAKKEAARMPLLGQLMRARDFVFLDRGNRAAAIEALRPAVDRIARGLSLAIAPEGTRSHTARLGPFKKGAFHAAIQSGAPIVPVVFRDNWHVMPRDSLVFRPGTVHVRVLPPIEVGAWRVEDIDAHVAEVRDLYQRTLDDWPVGRGP